MSPKLPENTPDPAQIAQEALAMARALQGGGIFGPRVQAQLSALRLCLAAAKVALSAAKLAAAPLRSGSAPMPTTDTRHSQR